MREISRGDMNVKLVLSALIIPTAVSLANVTFSDYALADFPDPDADETTCGGGKRSIKAGVVQLLNYVAGHYLGECVNVILYDENYESGDERLNFDLERMLKEFPANFINGQIKEAKRIDQGMLQPIENECRNFILLLTDLTWTVTLLGSLRYSKVVVVTVSSRWKIEEYLEGWQARDIVNLLIVSYNWKANVLFGVEEADDRISDINLYTHNLYTDGLGSSSVRLLTSWRCGRLTRDVNLFPKKMTRGFNGRQFIVAASEQPPFTFKKRSAVTDESNESHLWDGVEIRLLRLLSSFLNYTIEIVEPKMVESYLNGPSERVIAEVMFGEAEIGSAGVYITNDRIAQIMPSAPHTIDCAAFITKASTALPGHRAILGPFHWTVWLALTMTYMSAILPLTFADSHSLRPLLKNPWLIEQMFWHVFGNFTNCFTFAKDNWTKSKKTALRLFVGLYWAFTIIVTACYTGSIVSFITLYVFPDVIDHLDQLVKKNFRIGTLSTGGWARWFNNSEHEKTRWLLRDVELVPNTTQGLKNVSHSFYLPMFRPYAFLAGRAQMEYIVQANYTHTKKKELLHITKDCFVPFSVSYVFPMTAAYSDLFNEYILRVQQSGLMAKLLNEFKWEVERTAGGKLLQAGSGAALREITPLNRKLTLYDTAGMYLLMGAGYLIGLVALIAELIHYAKQHRKRVTFRQRLARLLFWRSERFRRLVDRFISILSPYIHALRRKDAEDGSNYNSFKKYDSRILGARPTVDEGLVNSGYHSDLVLNRRSVDVPNECQSMPDVGRDCRSCVTDEEVHQVNRRKDLDVVFGSINSLPWEFSKAVHRRSSRALHRVQSC